MEMNFSYLFAIALIPLLIGFLWYHPKVFGTAWMKAADLTEEKIKGSNMILIFGLTYLFSLLAAAALISVTIHQASVQSLFAGQPGFGTESSELTAYFNDFMARYGQLHRSFGHGALHGGVGAVFLILPVLTINALFERRGFKYIIINFGFWFVSFVLMGGAVCHFV